MDLDRREAEARSRLAATLRDLPEPSALARAREREHEAREASHAAFYGWLDVERRARAACERPEPRGLWSILTGQRVEWRREVDEARATLAAIDARRADARKAAADAAAVFGPLDRLWRADAEAARRWHAIEERRTADELALLGAARRVLAAEPTLASGTEAVLLDAARRRLSDEARAAEEAERRRQAREDRERDRLIEARRVRLPLPELDFNEYRGPRR
ncbi:hypothetical protein GCM10011390_51240 [Aureimonas endophytica]|uniref:Uncharacterized protein n=1 Tax=Aureimonas endophytica TaxID=2027858 RepID=A0A917EEH9_9HYPH|nr:hypothetical protein GCM10011390_51240 [Aureimonas endophytica]